MNAKPPPELAPDDLLEMELRVARRADELAQQLATPADAAQKLDCWLQAEREIFSAEPVDAQPAG